MWQSAALPRSTRLTEDEALSMGEVRILFMEKTLDGVHADETLKPHYTEIFSLMSNVGQDILQKYAFDYAYYLYSCEEAVRTRRLAFELEASKANEKKDEASGPALDDS